MRVRILKARRARAMSCRWKPARLRRRPGRGRRRGSRSSFRRREPVVRLCLRKTAAARRRGVQNFFSLQRFAFQTIRLSFRGKARFFRKATGGAARCCRPVFRPFQWRNALEAPFLPKGRQNSQKARRDCCRNAHAPGNARRQGPRKFSTLISASAYGQATFYLS